MHLRFFNRREDRMEANREDMHHSNARLSGYLYKLRAVYDENNNSSGTGSYDILSIVISRSILSLSPFLSQLVYSFLIYIIIMTTTNYNCDSNESTEMEMD